MWIASEVQFSPNPSEQWVLSRARESSGPFELYRPRLWGDGLLLMQMNTVEDWLWVASCCLGNSSPRRSLASLFLCRTAVWVLEITLLCCWGRFFYKRLFRCWRAERIIHKKPLLFIEFNKKSSICMADRHFPHTILFDPSISPGVIQNCVTIPIWICQTEARRSMWPGHSKVCPRTNMWL